MKATLFRILTIVLAVAGLLGADVTASERGQVVESFSDFRTVDGLVLPFRCSATWNGEEHRALSSTTRSIVVNPEIDATLFERPTNGEGS